MATPATTHCSEGGYYLLFNIYHLLGLLTQPRFVILLLITL